MLSNKRIFTIVVAIVLNGFVSIAGPSDADGFAETIWNTQSPNKKRGGGTMVGGYTATTIGVTASGFVWDQIPTSAVFTIGQ